MVLRFYHMAPNRSSLRCHMRLCAVLCVNHCCDSQRIEKETPRFAAHSIQSQTTVPERSRSADPAQPKQLTVGVFSARSSNRKRLWSDSCDERPGGRLCSGARRPALARNEGLPARRLRLYASRSLDTQNSNRRVFPAMWVMHRLYDPAFAPTLGFRTQAGDETPVDQATMRNRVRDFDGSLPTTAEGPQGAPLFMKSVLLSARLCATCGLANARLRRHRAPVNAKTRFRGPGPRAPMPEIGFVARNGVVVA